MWCNVILLVFCVLYTPTYSDTFNHKARRSIDFIVYQENIENVHSYHFILKILPSQLCIDHALRL